jgi:hypothetical protein
VTSATGNRCAALKLARACIPATDTATQGSISYDVLAIFGKKRVAELLLNAHKLSRGLQTLSIKQYRLGASKYQQLHSVGAKIEHSNSRGMILFSNHLAAIYVPQANPTSTVGGGKQVL